MKRLNLSLILASTLILSISGCSTDDEEEGNNIARAHAIRAEAGSPRRKVSDTHHEMNLDRDRAEVMKRLSRNDPDWK